MNAPPVGCALPAPAVALALAIPSILFRDSEVIRRHSDLLPGPQVPLSLIPCDQKLPSGKTVPERMKLDPKLPQAGRRTARALWAGKRFLRGRCAGTL